MQLFTIGPVNMFDYTRKTGEMQLPYFRTAQFSEVVLEINSLFKKASYAPDDSEVVILTASGTAAMEATITNCLNTNTRVLVVNGGTFGHRFEELCRFHSIPHDVLHVPFNEDLTAEMLDRYSNKGYFAMLINKHETGIGKLYSSSLISDFCKKENMYLLVDAISSIFADEYNIKQIGADITFVSSQKALALPPGISIVVISKRIYDNVIKKNKQSNMYLSFEDYVINAKRGQTPYTPAVGIIYQLRERLSHLVNDGIDKEVERINQLAGYFRERIVELPFTVPAYTLSNCITPIITQKVNVKKMFELLIERYGIFVTPCPDPNAKTMLRIGHIGDLNKTDYDDLIDKMGFLIKHGDC